MTARQKLTHLRASARGERAAMLDALIAACDLDNRLNDLPRTDIADWLMENESAEIADCFYGAIAKISRFGQQSKGANHERA